MNDGQGKKKSKRRATYVVVEPLADEMDADAGHHGRLVLEAHGGQVQTATTHSPW